MNIASNINQKPAQKFRLMGLGWWQLILQLRGAVTLQKWASDGWQFLAQEGAVFAHWAIR